MIIEGNEILPYKGGGYVMNGTWYFNTMEQMICKMVTMRRGMGFSYTDDLDLRDSIREEIRGINHKYDLNLNMESKYWAFEYKVDS